MVGAAEPSCRTATQKPAAGITHRHRSMSASRCWKRWCRQIGLNYRPHPYQGCALPLSYGGFGGAGRCHSGAGGASWLRDMAEPPDERSAGPRRDRRRRQPARAAGRRRCGRTCSGARSSSARRERGRSRDAEPVEEALSDPLQGRHPAGERCGGNGDHAGSVDPRDGAGARHDRAVRRPADPRGRDLLRAVVLRLRRARGARVPHLHQRRQRAGRSQELQRRRASSSATAIPA